MPATADVVAVAPLAAAAAFMGVGLQVEALDPTSNPEPISL